METTTKLISGDCAPLYANYPPDVKVEIIEMVVCRVQNLKREELSSICKKREVACARQVIYTFVKVWTNYGLRRIGAKYNQPHSTVYHAITRTLNQLDVNDKYIMRLISACATECIRLYGINLFDLGEQFDFTFPHPIITKLARGI